MSLESAQMKTLFRNLVRAYHFDQMMYRRITTGQLVGVHMSSGVYRYELHPHYRLRLGLPATGPEESGDELLNGVKVCANLFLD